MNPVWPRTIAPLASAIAFFTAALSLAGLAAQAEWIVRLDPDGRVMAPLTGLGVMGLAAALWLIARGQRLALPRRVAIVRGITAGVGLLGLLKLADLWLGLGVGFDRFTLPASEAIQSRGQMPPVVALSFILLGAAIFLSTFASFRASQLMPALFAGIIAWLGLDDDIYGGGPLLPQLDMPIATTIALLALSVGLFFARRDRGLKPLLVSDTSGGLMARRLVLPIVFVPVVTGWLLLRGHGGGWYDVPAAFGLFVLFNVIFFGWLIWLTAEQLAQSDTHRQQTVAALGQTEQRLTTVIENLSEGLVVSDLDGQLLHWNRAALEMHGFHTLDECRLRLPDFTRIFKLSTLDGTVLPLERWPLARIMRGEALRDFEVRLKRLGPEAWEKVVSYGGALVHESGGKPLAFVTITDISDRKRAEAALRESEERYRRVIDEARDAVFTLAADQAITSLNPAFEAITGFKREDWIGRKFTSLIEPHNLEPALMRFQNALRGERLPPFELSIRRSDGTYAALEFVGSAHLVAGEPAGIIGIGRDVTARRHLEAQLRQAQKMESLGTLAGGIAHDFNNILAAISGYTELAKLSVHETEPREYLGNVCEATVRATSLVRQILTFSRQEPMQRRPLQLTDVVTESLKLLRASIPSTIEFETALPADSWPVMADATQVHQVVMNLGTNAWHAMKGQPGTLRIEVQNMAIDEHVAATNPNLKSGPYVRVSVSDTGCGMDRTTMERIFEPFFTTKPAGEGTGLGLAVVHGIMSGHGGAVTVYSDAGRGTTFHLYFPAQKGRLTDDHPAAPAIPRGRGERVLFVDDEAPLASMGRLMVNRLGYVGTHAVSPSAALALVRANPTAFDLVITDFTMPGITGVDLATALHEIRPDLPVILMTGYTIGLTLERLRPIGIRALLVKPQSMESLAAAIREALAARTG